VVAGAKTRQTLTRLRRVGQQLLRARQQVVTGRCQRGAGVGAVEERRAALPLQLEDLLAQRRLGDVESFGRGREGAALCDLDEIAVVAQLGDGSEH
jgi:hypothetical protein